MNKKDNLLRLLQQHLAHLLHVLLLLHLVLSQCNYQPRDAAQPVAVAVAAPAKPPAETAATAVPKPNPPD